MSLKTKVGKMLKCDYMIFRNTGKKTVKEQYAQNQRAIFAQLIIYTTRSISSTRIIYNGLFISIKHITYQKIHFNYLRSTFTPGLNNPTFKSVSNTLETSFSSKNNDFVLKNDPISNSKIEPREP